MSPRSFSSGCLQCADPNLPGLRVRRPLPDQPLGLGNLGIDDLGDPRRFRYRFVGTAIDGVNGQFRTGKYLDKIDLGGLTEKTVAMMHDVVDRREPSYFQGEFVCRDDRILRYERVAMPLTSDGKTVTSILVGLQYLLVVESYPTSRYEKLPAYLGWREKLRSLFP